MREHTQEAIAAAISDALADDIVLSSFWSGRPECDVFPDRGSDTAKHVLVTVFIDETKLNAANVEAVIKRMVEVVRPHLFLSDDLCAFVGWIAAGDAGDNCYRVLKFSIAKESLDGPSLNLLHLHIDKEYYNAKGVSFIRYCLLE